MFIVQKIIYLALMLKKLLILFVETGVLTVMTILLLLLKIPSERYFALTPNSTKRSPQIQHDITILEGEYNLYFRCVNDM